MKKVLSIVAMLMAAITGWYETTNWAQMYDMPRLDGDKESQYYFACIGSVNPTSYEELHDYSWFDFKIFESTFVETIENSNYSTKDCVFNMDGIDTQAVQYEWKTSMNGNKMLSYDEIISTYGSVSEFINSGISSMEMISSVYATECISGFFITAKDDVADEYMLVNVDTWEDNMVQSEGWKSFRNRLLDC